MSVSCDMVAGCSAPVAYIGSKGYAYCATHGRERASFGYERCRKLAAWEREHIAAGRALLSYAPITKAEDTRRRAEIAESKRERAAARLEALRVELRAERISYGELAELQSLAEFIAPDDVELLEAAGVPEGCLLDDAETECDGSCRVQS